MRKSVSERFWEKVDKSGECWVWTASTHHQWGYGHFKFRGKVAQAHRVSWEMHNGPIPEGLLVCHRCDNPPCIRPAHLFLGTDADNATDMVAKRRHYRGTHNVLKTHCPQGHEYTPENTRVRHDPRGWTMRFCKECSRIGVRAAYRKYKEKRSAKAKLRTAATRARDPEAFRARGREYMRASRARRKAVREAAGIAPAPRRYPLRERTHCAAGHEYTAENTRVYHGKRVCRACMHAFYLKYKAAKHCQPPC